MNFPTDHTPNQEPMKARNVMTSPFRRESRGAVKAHYFLGWFTVPVEVIFRRHFGRRWMTFKNLFAGFIVLAAFAGLQYLYNWLFKVVPPLLDKYNIYHWTPPFHEATRWLFFLNHSMTFILVLYLFTGTVHLFMIWWRERSRNAKHSYYEGTSWLMPLGILLAKILHILAWPFMRFFMILFVRGGWKKKMPPLIEDPGSLTKIIVEPLALIGLMFVLTGPAIIWLAISAVATTTFATERKRTQMNKMRDMRDSMLQAYEVNQERERPSAKKEKPKRNGFLRKTRSKLASNDVAPLYPDLSTIIEELHQDRNVR